MKRFAVNGLIAALGLAAGIAVSMGPWRSYMAQRKLTNQNLSDLKRSETDKEEALRREAQVSSAMGREELARKQGWAKPGEIPADHNR